MSPSRAGWRALDGGRPISYNSTNLVEMKSIDAQPGQDARMKFISLVRQAGG
jgi:hypothetical protein